jgi:hypothetical protein
MAGTEIHFVWIDRMKVLFYVASRLDVVSPI